MKKGVFVLIIVLLAFSLVADLGEQSLDNVKWDWRNGPTNKDVWELKDYVGAESLIIYFDHNNSLDNLTVELQGLDSVTLVQPLGTCNLAGGIVSCNNFFTSNVIELEVISSSVEIDTVRNLNINTSDTETGDQTWLLTLSVLNDSLAPRYVLNYPDNYQFVKNGSILFNVTVTEDESGLDYAKLHYENVNNESDKSEAQLNADLICVNDFCTTTEERDGNEYVGFYFEIVDKAGNKDYNDWNDATWYYVYVDKDIPIIKINTLEESSSNSDNHNLNYNLTENTFAIGGSFNPEVNCSVYLIDGENHLMVGSEKLYNNAAGRDLNVDLSVVDDETYSWYIKCFDSAGWITQSSSRTLIIDRYGPNITLTSHNNGSVVNNNIYINFSITDIPSGVEKIWWRKGESGDKFNQLSYDNIYSVLYQVYSGNLSSDANNLQIYANDTVGNPSNENYTIYVDDQGPGVTLVYPGDDDYGNETFIVNVTDIYSDELTCDLNIDGSTYTQQATVNQHLTYTIDLEEDGQYIWNVTCTDEVGNVGSNRWKFTLDTTAPQITLLYPLNTLPYNISNVYSKGRNDFNYSVYDRYEISTCLLYINDVNKNSSDGENFTNILLGLDSSNLPYNWYITCNDTIGNENTSETGYVYYDIYSPNITNVGNNAPGSSSAVITWNVNEKSNNTVFYGTNITALSDSLPDTETVTNPSITLSSLSAETQYYYYVQSCDQFQQCSVDNNSDNFYTFNTTATPQNPSGSSSGSGGGSSRTIPDEEEIEDIGDCREDWSCDSWTNCQNGQQTRTCWDWEVCGTTVLKPDESRSCQSSNSLIEQEETDGDTFGASDENTQTTNLGVGRAVGIFDRIKSSWLPIVLALIVIALLALVGWKRKPLLARVKGIRKSKVEKEESEIREKLKLRGIIK